MTTGNEKRNSIRKRKQASYLAVVFLCVFLSLFFIYEGVAFSGYPVKAADASTGEVLTAEELGGVNRAVPGKGRSPLRVLPDREFTIISVGDIMMHSPQTKAGRDPADDSYDFSFMFEKVAPILREGDLVIGNLETPLAGLSNGGYTGYPMFNAPEILAQNLKEAGFTLVSTANNHSLDRKYAGLCATLDHLDEAGLMHAGTFRTSAERDSISHIKIKGVKIAFIAATYGTNGLSLPAEYGFAINYIDAERLLDDIRKARREGAGYIIVMLHWGAEYQTQPNQEQTTLADTLLKGGADLILGNHPHVLQRGEIILPIESSGDPKAPDREQAKFVMYSQGNFVSNQEGMNRLVSIMLKLTIGVDGATGKPYLKEAGYIPIYTQRRNRQGESRHTVWPLELALEELESGGIAFGAEDRANIPKAWDYAIKSQPGLRLLTLKDTPVFDE